MANIAVAFGFRHVGYVEGAAPTYGLRRRKIALGNTNPIFHNDPVHDVAGPTGYIEQSPSTPASGSFCGVFSHCEYFSVSQQRKVRSNYWPGSDAQFDVDAFIIDTVGALFLAAADAGPITFASVDRNIDFTIATGGSSTPTAGQGNTVSQLSGATLKFSTIGSTATFPFRIYKLYSDDVVPGAPNAGATSPNGADNTTAFNWAVVTFNSVAFKQLTSL
jgi:hypothetical protein